MSYIKLRTNIFRLEQISDLVQEVPKQLFGNIINNQNNISGFLDELEICDFINGQLVKNESRTIETIISIKETLPGFLYRESKVFRLNNTIDGYDEIYHTTTATQGSFKKSRPLIEESLKNNPLLSTNKYILAKYTNSEKLGVFPIE